MGDINKIVSAMWRTVKLFGRFLPIFPINQNWKNAVEPFHHLNAMGENMKST